VPAINDVIDDGENGLLVFPADPPALAGAIAKIRSDADLRNHLIAGGHRIVAERFSWDKILPEYREILGLVS
jgi:glycosyltransferase involved in cell wall biosynthesis